MTIQTATYRNVRISLYPRTCNDHVTADHPNAGTDICPTCWRWFPVAMANRVDTFSNTFRYSEYAPPADPDRHWFDHRIARLAPVAVKSLNDLARKDA